MNQFRSGLSAALLSLTAISAQADTLQVNFSYKGPTFDYGPIVLTTPPLPVTSLTASPFLVTNLTTLGSFEAFCLEPFQPLSGSSIGVGDPSYSSGALSTPINIAAIQTLYNRYYSTALTSGLTAAAFQFAIWELASDTGMNLSSGPNFAMPADPARTLGQQMLDGTAPQAAAIYTLVQWSSLGSQDLIQPVPIPEPGTYALMLAGLMGIGAWARRRHA